MGLEHWLGGWAQGLTDADGGPCVSLWLELLFSQVLIPSSCTRGQCVCAQVSGWAKAPAWEPTLVWSTN